MNTSQFLIIDGGRSKPTPVPLIKRSPLVLPNDPEFTTLPWTPPNTRDFLRADSWGIHMPNFPWVPGATSLGPEYWERVLSWFLDRYSVDQQLQYLRKTASYGYTHVKLSVDDSMGPKDNGPNSPPGNAQSLQQLIDTCGRVQSVGSAVSGRGLYVSMMLASKYFQPANMSLQQYQDRVGPVLEALLKAKVVDEVLPAWEWNLWNDPGRLDQPPSERPSVAIPKWVGRQAHAAGVSCWMHFGSECVAWFADKDPRGRFGYWQDLAEDVDGINYQTFPNWKMRETQDRLIDTLWQFGEEGNAHKLRFDEDQASYEWEGTIDPDGQPADEGETKARGFCALCTIDNVRRTDARIWGYGNGASQLDGSPI